MHGRQHYECTPFFHKSKADFILAIARDEDKIEWCELNNIDILTLKYSGSDYEWRKTHVALLKANYKELWGPEAPQQGGQ